MSRRTEHRLRLPARSILEAVSQGLFRATTIEVIQEVLQGNSACRAEQHAVLPHTFTVQPPGTA